MHAYTVFKEDESTLARSSELVVLNLVESVQIGAQDEISLFPTVRNYNIAMRTEDDADYVPMHDTKTKMHKTTSNERTKREPHEGNSTIEGSWQLIALVLFCIFVLLVAPRGG